MNRNQKIKSTGATNIPTISTNKAKMEIIRPSKFKCKEKEQDYATE